MLQTILSSKNLGIIVLSKHAFGMVAAEFISRHAFVYDAFALDTRNIRNTTNRSAVHSK